MPRINILNFNHNRNSIRPPSPNKPMSLAAFMQRKKGGSMVPTNVRGSMEDDKVVTTLKDLKDERLK